MRASIRPDRAAGNPSLPAHGRRSCMTTSAAALPRPGAPRAYPRQPLRGRPRHIHPSPQTTKRNHQHQLRPHHRPAQAVPSSVPRPHAQGAAVNATPPFGRSPGPLVAGKAQQCPVHSSTHRPPFLVPAYGHSRPTGGRRDDARRAEPRQARDRHDARSRTPLTNYASCRSEPLMGRAAPLGQFSSHRHLARWEWRRPASPAAAQSRWQPNEPQVARRAPRPRVWEAPEAGMRIVNPSLSRGEAFRVRGFQLDQTSRRPRRATPLARIAHWRLETKIPNRRSTCLTVEVGATIRATHATVLSTDPDRGA